MKAAVRIFAAALLMMLISGCMMHTELDKTAIIEAVGIDLEDGTYKVTVQYFNMDKSGGSAIVDETEPNVIVTSGKGKSVPQAVDDLSAVCGKRLMPGNLSVIVIGQGAAKEDIGELLSFVRADQECDLRAYAAAAEGKAEDIMNVRFTEGNSSAEKLSDVIENAHKLGICSPVKLFSLFHLLGEPTRSFVLPVLGVRQELGDFTEDKSGAVITGGMLFSGGKAVGKLSPEELSGLMLLSDEAGEARLSTGQAGALLSGIKSRVSAALENGRLVIDVTITARCTFVIPASERDEIKQLKTALEKTLCERVCAAFAQTVTRHGADAAGLRFAVMAQPDIRNAVMSDYSSALRNSALRCNCSLTTEI